MEFNFAAITPVTVRRVPGFATRGGVTPMVNGSGTSASVTTDSVQSALLFEIWKPQPVNK